MKAFLLLILSFSLMSCGMLRFDINGVDKDKIQASSEGGCHSDSECGEGRVCATIKGEYPGSCVGTMSEENIGTDWKDHYAKVNAKFDAAKKPEDEFPVVNEAITPESIASFKRLKCVKTSDKKCEDLFKEMLHARLGLAYTKEGRAIFEENCIAKPEICDKPVFMEMAYIRAHNIEIENKRKEWFADEKATVDAEVRATRPVLILHSP